MDPDGLRGELLDRLRQRDESVLPALIARHGSRLAGTIKVTWQGILEHDVEELVADVIADAWFHADEVDLARASFDGWLAMRARYRTLDRLRDRQRDRGLVGRLAEVLRPSSVGPEYASDLDAYLVGLTDLERTLVWLRFMEGRPVVEVAKRCGLTSKAAERRLARLRDRLRKGCASEAEIGATSHA